MEDSAIEEAARAFAAIIQPPDLGHFIEDFTMGAKWARRKMRQLYEEHEPTIAENTLYRSETGTLPPTEPQTSGGTESRP